ncbi:MAG: SDR family NAD(P)-dependent oxidoreductase [Gammaproteobacteria bacterium]|nr:SDR family NAD(P)-dependent oxidoreductase [Gammaproteobacteria bacterium]
MTQAQQSIFITGNSSGLGRGLSAAFLKRGCRIFGCSRRGYTGLEGDLKDIQCDLTNFNTIPVAMETLLGKAKGLDLVLLNAGILGEIKTMAKTSMDEIRHIMDINVWSNKLLLDWLLTWDRPVAQIILISSGAAVLGNKGWGGYALSKATLNMLAQLYAHEFPDTHISALAPGLIDTAMMDYLCVEPDPVVYPALNRIRNARGTDVMASPDIAAERIISVLEEVRRFPSGSFVDIRQILEPEEYQKLMSARHQSRSAPVKE